jgi:hypothetical protein
VLERPKPSRQRTRRYRQRQAKGLMCVMVEIDAARLSTVAQLQRLSDRQCEDKAVVGAAIARLIDSIEI